jgi:hypothetical protein
MPLVLGAAQAGWRLSAAWLLPPAVLLLFLAHYALQPAGRRLLWAAVYAIASVVLFTAVVLLSAGQHRVWLLTIAAVSAIGGGGYTMASIAGAGRRIATELCGMVAMSLSAPMMALAAETDVDMRLAAAPAMAFGYSVSILSFVRAYTGRRQGRTAATAVCVVVHVVLLGGLAALGEAGWLPSWWWAAFLPVIWRTAWGLARPPRTLRAVGMRELWVSLVFTAIAAAMLLWF